MINKIKLAILLFCSLPTSNLIAQTTNLGASSGTGGTSNVHIGFESGKVSTANFNAFLGYQTGKANTTGTYNSFFGYKAGLNNTTRSYNTFIGYGAGTTTNSSEYNTFVGFNAGTLTTSGSWNCFVGARSGQANTTGYSNNFIGYVAGQDNTTGFCNSFTGHLSGWKNTTGQNNTFHGFESGMQNTIGNFNTSFGSGASRGNQTGNNNCAFGFKAGYLTNGGSNNTFLGYQSGYSSVTGNNNVFLGYQAGYNELGSDKLYIDNSNTSQPLIYGDFNLNLLTLNGKVGINTSTFPTTVGAANVSSYGLFVKGGILTEELRVRTGWADYVFEENYQLMPLENVELYLKANKHLPNVPSAQTIQEEGLDLGEITKIQQEKIEELTLYLIELSNKLKEQQEQINQLLQK